MSKIKEKFFKLLIRQAKNAGLPAVKNLVDEKGRLDEINRLNLVDRELTNEKYANNITELACYLTGKPQCSINLLTDKSQFSKNNHGFIINLNLFYWPSWFSNLLVSKNFLRKKNQFQ